MEQSTLSIGTVTVQSISKATKPTAAHPNDVKFKVEYPEDFKGKKQMPEGVVIISKESAEQFTKAGIGHIVVEPAATETKEVVKEADNAPMAIPVQAEASKESAEQFTKAEDNVVVSEEEGSKTKSQKPKNK